MGYGEFGGGGSVKWIVQHGSKTAFDVDPAGKGNFKLVIRGFDDAGDAKANTKFGPNGTITIEVPVSENPKQIRIDWPNS